MSERTLQSAIKYAAKLHKNDLAEAIANLVEERAQQGASQGPSQLYLPQQVGLQSPSQLCLPQQELSFANSTNHCMEDSEIIPPTQRDNSQSLG